MGVKIILKFFWGGTECKLNKNFVVSSMVERELF
jgi:hypothetical protein